MPFPPDEATRRYWFVTLWPAARMLRRLDQYGALVGVRVAHRHDRAWLFRHHMLVVTGPQSRVSVFDHVTRRILSSQAMDAMSLAGTGGGR